MPLVPTVVAVRRALPSTRDGADQSQNDRAVLETIEANTM
mgnify:CR=1 FL=1